MSVDNIARGMAGKALKQGGGGTTNWGGIGGDISSQSDLQNALDNKVEKTQLEEGYYNKKEVEKVSNSTYNASIAYTDSLIKEYETISLYLKTDGISTTRPTGAGSTIPALLTTREQLIKQFDYTTPNVGVVLKDNLYNLDLYFTSISLNRTTYIRAVYTVNNIEIFDVTTPLNNAVGEYELYRQVLNQQSVDTNYPLGAKVSLKIYGYVSSGSDEVGMVVNDVDKPSGLYRNAPISTLSANKIMATKGQEVMSQQELNDYILNIIENL